MNVGMFECLNEGLEGLGGLESLEFRGNRKSVCFIQTFEHSNIQTILTSANR
jgi:hypothetical protein